MPYEHSSCVLLADSHHSLKGARRVQPDVAVVDLSLSRHGDLDWLRAVRERCLGMKVVVLSVHDERSVRQAAIDAGADAFVLKRAIATDLLPAIARLRAG